MDPPQKWDVLLECCRDTWKLIEQISFAFNIRYWIFNWTNGIYMNNNGQREKFVVQGTEIGSLWRMRKILFSEGMVFHESVILTWYGISPGATSSPFTMRDSKPGSTAAVNAILIIWFSQDLVRERERELAIHFNVVKYSLSSHCAAARNLI